ncbi:MAG: GIY-YIG nuclease family protein [Christensenellales bacterium]|jgi:hypothetical protein
MFKLNDLLNFSKEDFDFSKVRFNNNTANTDPIELFVSNPEEVNTNWLFWRGTRRYFNEGDIAICLVRMSHISKDMWLLTTIKKVTKELGVTKEVNYEGEELKEYEHLYGRVVLKYNKTQAQLEHLKTCNDKMEVLQILPSIFDGEEFKGYDKVKLSWKQLEIIVKRKKSTWVNALGNQKGIYLITDLNNGKHYVGKASSENGMLLNRWSAYIRNGHGGNKELREIYNSPDKGFEYIKQNFQYTLLENYNQRVDDKYIDKREVWWKEALASRKFGYNRN